MKVLKKNEAGLRGGGLCAHVNVCQRFRDDKMDGRETNKETYPSIRREERFFRSGA